MSLINKRRGMMRSAPVSLRRIRSGRKVLPAPFVGFHWNFPSAGGRIIRRVNPPSENASDLHITLWNMAVRIYHANIGRYAAATAASNDAVVAVVTCPVCRTQPMSAVRNACVACAFVAEANASEADAEALA